MSDADQLHGRAIIAIQDMRDEIERLRAEVAGWKEQHGRDSVELRRLCASRDEAERELAELRERIEKAPVRDTYVEGEHGRELVWLYDEVLPKEFKGHRVRLLVEESGS